MANKRVWTGSGLLLCIFFIRVLAGVNDSFSLDVQPNSSTSVTPKSVDTDDVEAIEHNVTASPFNVQHDNNQTAGVMINATANSMNSTYHQNDFTPSLESTLAPASSRSTKARLTQRPRDRNESQVKTERDFRSDEPLKYDDKWDDPFKYDYTSLRQAGLTVAAVFFLLGIMLITCGKLRCRRRCQMTKGRSYEVTRM